MLAVRRVSGGTAARKMDKMYWMFSTVEVTVVAIWLHQVLITQDAWSTSHAWIELWYGLFDRYLIGWSRERP